MLYFSISVTYLFCKQKLVPLNPFDLFHHFPTNLPFGNHQFTLSIWVCFFIGLSLFPCVHFDKCIKSCVHSTLKIKNSSVAVPPPRTLSCFLTGVGTSPHQSAIPAPVQCWSVLHPAGLPFPSGVVFSLFMPCTTVRSELWGWLCSEVESSVVLRKAPSRLAPCLSRCSCLAPGCRAAPRWGLEGFVPISPSNTQRLEPVVCFRVSTDASILII